MNKDKKEVWDKLKHVPPSIQTGRIVDFVVTIRPGSTDFKIVPYKK